MNPVKYLGDYRKTTFFTKMPPARIHSFEFYQEENKQIRKKQTPKLMSGAIL